MRGIRRIFPWLGLVLIVLAAFGVRRVSYDLPVVSDSVSAFFREEEGAPYFADPDSYYWLRKAEELERGDGFPFSETRDSDPLIGSRKAESAETQRQLLGLPILTALIRNLLRLFSSVSLIRVAVWIAPVLSSLAAIPPFFYLRKRHGTSAALTAGALAALAVPFAFHSCVGYFDSDAALSVLPLTAMLGMARCLRAKSTREQIGFGLLSAAAMTVTAIFWQFAMVYWALAMGCGLCQVLFYALCQRRIRKHGNRSTEDIGENRICGNAVNTGKTDPIRVMARGLLICGALMVALPVAVMGAEAFPPPQMVAELAAEMLGLKSEILPDASRYVAEMQPLAALPRSGSGLSAWLIANRGSLLGLLGGLPACLAAGLALPAAGLLAHLNKIKVSVETEAGFESDPLERNEFPWGFADLAYLIPWMLVTVPMALKHQRFAQLAALPAALLAGYFVALWGRLIRHAHPLRRIQSPCLRAAGRGFLSALLCLVLTVPVLIGAGNSVRDTLPVITDARTSAMAFIRDSLPENTAIASWWDDGYYTEYAARRRSLADGGTYDSTVSFFLAKALMAEDPRLTRGILRMLETAGTEAVDRLTEAGVPEGNALELLLRILPSDRAEAAAILDKEKDLPLAIADKQELLDRTHPEETRPLALVLGTDLLTRIRLLADCGLLDLETGKAPGVSCVLSERSEALPREGESSSLSFHESAYRLIWTDRGENPPGICLFLGEREMPVGRLRIWRQGHLMLQEDYGPGPAVVLLMEEDRWCGAVMSDELCDTVLIRLLMCEDREMTGFVKLGAWFGPKTDPCAAQRRISSWNMLSWCTQVFAVLE